MTLCEPKCPNCDGSGTVARGKKPTRYDRCPRCDGSGYERMVALGEVEAWLPSVVGLNLDEAEKAAVRRFGGGER